MIPFLKSENRKRISPQQMTDIYNCLKTPYKLGAVCKLDGEYTDSPSVFKLNNKWYMMYLAISEECAASGYYTRLAVSDDLVNWQTGNTIMTRNNQNNWDSKQVAGYLGLPDIDWNSGSIPGKINDKYFVTYLGGNSDGYEPDPLYMGLAVTSDLNNPLLYERLPSPILSPDDKDCRKEENRALYRSFLFEDKEKVTGYPYVLVYNAKDNDYKERIFLAVSNDALNWERYGDKPVLDGTVGNPNNKIVGDAQILKIEGLYVMVYFSYDYNEKAFSTFACSEDLVNWTAWEGEPLIKSEYPWESKHAHKSWIVRSDGITYNYYCAVGENNERFIALASSVALNKSNL